MIDSEIKKLLNKHFKEKFKKTENQNEWIDSKKRIYLVLSDEEAEKEWERNILDNLISIDPTVVMYSLFLVWDSEAAQSLNKISEKASDLANDFLKSIVKKYGDIELIKQNCNRGEKLATCNELEEKIGELSDGTEMFAYRID